MTNSTKVAIVTGGSRGIGAAITEQLARDGFTVHVVYKNDHHSAEVLTRSLKKNGLAVYLHRANVAREEEVKKLIAEIVRVSGRIDVLVNNAAIVDDQLIALLDIDKWQRVIDANLTGPFLMIRETIPFMLDNLSGRIINISSNSARIPGPGQASYAASKGGLESLTRCVAVELGRKGIRANVVAPGRIKTDMTAGLTTQLGANELGARWGTPEDISAVVAFLASDAADYVQGQVMTVDGGRLVRRPSAASRKGEETA